MIWFCINITTTIIQLSENITNQDAEHSDQLLQLSGKRM